MILQFYSDVQKHTELHKIIAPFYPYLFDPLLNSSILPTLSATASAALNFNWNYTLLKAWNALRRNHKRAQPNDGFAKVLLELDTKLHGNISMEWQQKRPTVKVCSICGKHAGFSSNSLNLHLQKAHRKLSSGSVDSAMTEIKRLWEVLNITERQSHSSDC